MMFTKVLNNRILAFKEMLMGALFLLVLAQGAAVAQELEVTKPLTLSTQQLAATHQRLDFNGDACAVVVVQLDFETVDFEGDINALQYRQNGEWWLWMSKGARWLSVHTGDYLPLMVEFDPLQAGVTYELEIKPANMRQMLTAPKPLQEDLTMTAAVKYSRVDAQGRTCALARIGLVLPEVRFEGDVVASQYRDGEWWVWLTPGANTLTLYAAGYDPLTVMFEPVRPAVTYVMTVLKIDISQDGKAVRHTLPPVDQPFTVGGVTFTMVYVEGGTFTMGCTGEQGSECYDNEKPAHTVTLSDYYIGETEVTQALWRAVMRNNPSFWRGDELPVEQVSYSDVILFIAQLNAMTGREFRLPTEAEWEFAARGGGRSRGYKYSGGNTIGDVAWYSDNSGRRTHPVKQKKPNELGIYDMSGNVMEWCLDAWYNYSAESQVDPCQSGAANVNHWLRGGCWDDYPRHCRTTLRNIRPSARRDSFLGLRLVLSE